MKAYPKPAARKAEKQRASKRLSEYRCKQRELAVARDEGLCQICASKGVTRQARDVHHVFGRSHITSWREDFTALMCVCRGCHPAPLYSHDWSSDHEIVVLARKINGLRRMDDGSRVC